MAVIRAILPLSQIHKHLPHILDCQILLYQEFPADQVITPFSPVTLPELLRDYYGYYIRKTALGDKTKYADF